MARSTRLTLSGEAHLLRQQGHNQQPVFLDDEDRRRYLSDLREVCSDQGVQVHAYALLPAQVWLLLTPREGQALSRAMQALGRRYVIWHNQRHGRSGTLWQGRFQACVLEAGSHLLPAMRHIERQPLLSGLAPELLANADTSAAHHLGVRRDPLITDHPLYWALGNTPFDREAAYRRWLEQDDSPAMARAWEPALRQSSVLGSPAFIERLQQGLQRPLQRRPRGRPRKAPADDSVPI
jgi:putative transposase